MTRLVIAALLVVGGGGCSGKAVPVVHGEPIPPKRISVSWGLQPEGAATEVFLALTDETGKQVSHPVGRFKGACETITPDKAMHAIAGAACKTGGGGTELHAVVQGSEILVMQVTVLVDKTTPDPMAREEIMRVGFPLGAAVEGPR